MENKLKSVLYILLIALIAYNIYIGTTVQEIGIPGFTIKFGPKSTATQPAPPTQPPAASNPNNGNNAGGSSNQPNPVPVTLNLNYMSDESGWVTQSGSLGTGYDHPPQAGDFNNNEVVRGFLSFDLTTIPNNAIIQSAKLILPNSAVGSGDVFPNFGSLQFESVWYGLSLTPDAYNAPAYAVLQNAYGPSSTIGVGAGVETALQQGYRRFQIRFSFALGTDNDNSGEIYWIPDAPALEVVYKLP